MSTRVAFVVLGACAALAVTGLAQGAARDCMPVSVPGTFTYTVRIEAGSVGCGLARAVVRDAADWPPGESRETDGWSCSAGQDPASWAISCAHGAAIVRAYGPVLERDPWVTAEVRLRIGMLAPTSTAGLVVSHVRVRGCGDAYKRVVAVYTRPDGATLTVGEARPGCANIGIEPLLAVWRIHGQRARLSEMCNPTGCSRLWGDYALEWSERGVGITLLTHGLTRRELLTIARSMTAVPA